MENISELRKQLGVVFTELKNGSIDPKVAKEMNNAAGKIINSCRAQLEYAHLRGEKPKVSYLK